MDGDDLRIYLMAGERVVWSGRPKQGFILTPSDGFLIPFSLLWGGFAIFWEVSVFKVRAPAFFPVFGFVFVLLGLYFIFGRFLADAWIRRSMIYAITDRRILILRDRPTRKLVALNLDKLPSCDLVESSDGSGTIRFGTPPSIFVRRGSWGMWTPSIDPTPQFLRIENARNVFDQVQKLSASGGQSGDS